MFFLWGSTLNHSRLPGISVLFSERYKSAHAAQLTNFSVLSVNFGSLYHQPHFYSGFQEPPFVLQLEGTFVIGNLFKFIGQPSVSWTFGHGGAKSFTQIIGINWYNTLTISPHDLENANSTFVLLILDNCVAVHERSFGNGSSES